LKKFFFSLAVFACISAAAMGQSAARSGVDPDVQVIKANVAQLLLDIAAVEAKVDTLKADGDARDIAIAALTSPNVPSIEFDETAYAVAELISETFTGTWTDPNASASERVAEIYFTLNGQDITNDGTIDISNTALTSGTFSANSGPLNLLLDGVNLTVTIVDSDGNETSDTAALTTDDTLYGFDPLRELAGHPATEATIATWNTAPTWSDDTGSGFSVMRPGESAGGLQRTTTGYHGAAGIDGSGSKADFSYTATNTNHSLRFGIAIPSGSVLNWEVTVNAVSQGTGTVTGPVYLMGDPREITVDLGEYTSTVGQTVQVEFWTTVGGVAPSGDSEKCYWQYSEVLESSAARTYPGTNYFVDSVDGNNGTAVEGDPSLPWSSLRYLLENVAITSGSAGTPTYIWVERGHSETSVSGSANALNLEDKQWVIIKPYGTGPLPVFDADYEAPASGLFYTATNTSGTLFADRGFLNIRSCVSCGVEGLKIIDSAGTGIRIDNDVAASNISNNCWIRYCHITGSYKDGIRVENNDPDSATVLDDIVDPDASFNWLDGCNAGQGVGGKTPGGQSLTFKNVDYGSVIGNYLDHCWREGIDMIRVNGDSSQYTRVLHNRVYGEEPTSGYGPQTCMYADAANGTASYILFEGNWLGGSSDNMRVGLACVAESGGDAFSIIYRNNLVHDMGTQCFSFNDNGSGGTISNITLQGNTFEVPSGFVEYAISNGSTGSVTGFVVQANSISRPSAGAALPLMNWAGAGKTLTDNHFYNGSTGVTDADLGTSAVTGDPQWTSDTSDFFPFSHSYYPGASSPLLGETTLNAKRDMYKVRRGSAQDIGAFERP